MNNEARLALDEFLAKFDAFILACDEFEKSGRWDVRKHGLMSAFFEADLTGVVLQTMSADGVFERSEAEVANAMFGTSYTPADLRATYRSLGSVTEESSVGQARQTIKVLARLDQGLADTYRELILDAVTVVSLADGIAEGEERRLIRKLNDALGS